MELVPFNQLWSDSGSKLDLKGVYQRGDMFAPMLPIRRHHDHTRKGFVYVTLATRTDVNAVLDDLKARGVNLRAVDDSYEMSAIGAFKMAQYLAEQPQRDAKEEADLKARLDAIEAKKPKRAAKEHA